MAHHFFLCLQHSKLSSTLDLYGGVQLFTNIIYRACQIRPVGSSLLTNLPVEVINLLGYLICYSMLLLLLPQVIDICLNLTSLICLFQFALSFFVISYPAQICSLSTSFVSVSNMAGRIWIQVFSAGQVILGAACLLLNQLSDSRFAYIIDIGRITDSSQNLMFILLVNCKSN